MSKPKTKGKNGTQEAQEIPDFHIFRYCSHCGAQLRNKEG
jgi:hypothetical protein